MQLVVDMLWLRLRLCLRVCPRPSTRAVYNMYPLLRVAVCVSMPEVPSSPIPVLLSSTAVSLVRLSLLHPLQYNFSLSFSCFEGHG
jgi:hypothetical protein